MIDAPSRANWCPYLSPWKTPNVFSSNTRMSSALVASATDGPVFSSPALLMITSSGPRRRAASLNANSTPLSAEQSAAIYAVAGASVANILFARRPTIATRAPATAKRLATANPMPEVPP
jgi:hypothetical protein